MGLGPTHIIILLLIVVLLFGAGRVSTLMGDVAKGIKSFKKGMAEDDEAPARRLSDERPLETRAAPPAEPTPTNSTSDSDRAA
jgi:sec-independent protein translocase protein TatA